ncbi:DUF1998 domain-containing protein [Virgibacillus doumboii]|uniref:DUF1998 domain-containing protein n=1 Tax=Virgibacillus doumboii TaxID=2697503 RepID=UPI0013DEFF3E|nr:DUF1998 domain-containing protein [Virgibacillus doumboii]
MSKNQQKKQYDPELRYDVFRSNQFIGPFGVGSIVDFPNESVMPAGIDKWGTAGIPYLYDTRLQKRLNKFNITHFKKVPSKSEYRNGIPFYRFPKWLYCKNSRCGRLKHIDEWRKNYKQSKGKDSKFPTCNICNLKLVPSRFIVVCEKGHTDDFPWEKWVHKGNGCKNVDLRLWVGGSSSGLGGIVVECKGCGEKRNLGGAFNDNAHDEKSCTGFKPWLDEYDENECECTPKTLQRTASNVYFPKIVSSILIPPYSDQLIADIQQTNAWHLFQTQKNLFPDPSPLYESIADQLGKNINDVKRAIENINNTANGSIDEVEYRYQEYMALLGNFDKEEISSKDFVISDQEVENYNIPGIENMVLVNSLRELRALIAFSRVNPLGRDDYGVEDESENEGRGIPVKSYTTDWLPAIEVRGEGIFISFNENVLNDWQRNPEVQKRAEIINKRYESYTDKRGMEYRTISAKYILLHTLSHLLIRELSFECGYATSSLRERLYCNERDEQSEMSGILIYTASGDSEGTLGGLVRQGDSEFFNRIFANAVNRASWCSSDPLCIESEGQGMGALNLSACHACSLLPETSCEEFNRLLDRALVIGTPDKDIGFFNN